MMTHAILLIQCPDKKGIVAKVSNFLFHHGVNIVQSDQYSTDPEGGTFFIRVEFCFQKAGMSQQAFDQDLSALADKLQAQCCQLHYAAKKPRMGILLSKTDHCLVDLLYRIQTGEIHATVPLVLSNHPEHQEILQCHQIPFHYINTSKHTKKQAEKQMLSLLKKKTDFLVLARYMQILSADFLKQYAKDIINIHHSFLPSFKGASPYEQAFDRGVKLIGATAHYVTEDLDEGAIIDQKVEQTSHRDSLRDLKVKGRNLEKWALASAVRAHVEHRVIKFENKTIVFQS